MLNAIIKTARPYHWIKNLIVFAALIFARKYSQPNDIWHTILAFMVFCLGASAVYFFNDLADRENDKLHPTKKARPIPSGQLPVSIAWIIALVMLIVAVAGAIKLGAHFVSLLGVYIILNFAYSLGLKNIVILDVMSLAFGFVIRAAAGAAAINVPISSWLLICTILLALFLGFAKRRQELIVLGDDAVSHRRSLAHYSPYFLDQMIGVVTASTVIAYTFYTLSPEIKEKFGTGELVFTVPFVLYGIFRYLYLVHQKEEGGNPTKLLLTDIPLLICVALWVITVIVILQFRA
jgi:4-hydroxybenzoate polyprenyltransferase